MSTNATAMTRTKTDRRGALERPYARDHERSAEQRMSRGVMPKALPELVAWFREVVSDETPNDMHRPGVWRDFGTHAEGGSALGSPAYSDDFRRLIENSPHQTDPDGYYAYPVRACIARLSHRWPLMARHLFRLVLVECDWHRHADNVGWSHEEMEIYIGEALRRAWREYSEQSLRSAAA